MAGAPVARVDGLVHVLVREVCAVRTWCDGPRDHEGLGHRAWRGAARGFVAWTEVPHAAGLGELGKHGSLINNELGSSMRFSTVLTDMPLVADKPVDFGADDFCMSCNK